MDSDDCYTTCAGGAKIFDSEFESWSLVTASFLRFEFGSDLRTLNGLFYCQWVC